MMKMGAIFHGLLLFYFISGLRTVISQGKYGKEFEED